MLAEIARRQVRRLAGRHDLADRGAPRDGRLRTRYLDELADSLDDAVERALAAKRDRRAVSIDLQANAADVLPELLRRGFEADIVTDHTSAHAAHA